MLNVWYKKAKKENRFMPTTYTLGEKWEEYLKRKVSSGDFRSKSEVLRAGLRLMEHAELKEELQRRLLKMDSGEFSTLEDFNDKIGAFLTDKEKATGIEKS